MSETRQTNKFGQSILFQWLWCWIIMCQDIKDDDVQ